MTPTRFTVLVANIESAKARPELATLIDLHRPDAVIVLQAYRARTWLAGVAGYQHRQYRGREASGIAVLVAHDVVIERRHPLRMTRPWVGPKMGHQHRPRTYPAFMLSKGTHMVRLLAVHLPTHNNPAAQAESLAAVSRWFDRGPDTLSVAAGDFNREAHDIDDGNVLSTGKVDHAVTRSDTPSVSRRLPTPADCHGWGLYAFDLGTWS